MKRKATAVLAVSAMLSFGAVLTAHGADKTISHVSLNISWDAAPKAGALIGTVSASGGGEDFRVEGAVYLEEDDTWQQGMTPTAEIELSAQPGYRFKTDQKSYFTLSGCNARFKDAEIEEDGMGITLEISFPKINGTLPQTSAISWDGMTAVWDLVGGASRYEIRLYKDGKELTTVSTTGESYDFSDYINGEGSYYFMVRAAGSFHNQSSAWSDRSETKVLSRQDAWDCANGDWKKVGDEWRFIYKDKTYPSNCWRYINDQWYYFDSKGYMASDCYVKSDTTGLFHWLGTDGIWDAQWDTKTPQAGKNVLK